MPADTKPSQEAIEHTLLRNLYEAYFLPEGISNIHTILSQGGWDEATFDKVVNRMTHDGLIKGWSAGGNYRITSHGVIFAEQHAIAPEPLKKENEQLRTKFLAALAGAYDEGGSYSGVSYDTLAQQSGVDVYRVLNNIKILEDFGYTEAFVQGSVKITYKGLDAVKEWKQRSELVEEFERIQTLKPQPRGRALQKLLARVIEQQGWSQAEGVRTSHEEMDVIVFQRREYYLIECKWEKKAIEAPVVRELFGKLSNRIDVKGMLVSLSGFTSGAVTQVEEYINSRVILLFGAQDIHALLHEEKTFDELLEAKYHDLITRKRVVFQ